MKVRFWSMLHSPLIYSVVCMLVVSMQEKLIRMSEANDYYRIIGGSAEDDMEHLDELKRSITKRLHPDQFADNPELQRK